MRNLEESSGGFSGVVAVEACSDDASEGAVDGAVEDGEGSMEGAVEAMMAKLRGGQDDCVPLVESERMRIFLREEMNQIVVRGMLECRMFLV
jgi:hypothetical protein